MKDEQFSISMCVYGKDNPEWFEIAIESILNQTVKPSEVVLVVDGPIPQKIDSIIRKYEQNSIFKVIRFTENMGHGIARRAGLEACTNELVAIMDADDISLPDRFSLQIEEFAKNPELDIVGGHISEFVGQQTNIVGFRKVPIEDSDIKQYMKFRCPLNLVTVMFKKTSVNNAGGFVDWYCEEDYYLWLRMAQANMKFANVDRVLVNVRVGEEMYSRRGGMRYFKSEAKLQKYMLDNHMTNVSIYMKNMLIRFVVQVLLPNKLRGWVFKIFAREAT